MSIKAVKELPFRLIVLSLYVVVLVILLAHHEMWRDELQAWMIATAPSLSLLWRAAAYEPDPSLWFVILHGASAISTSPVVLQIVNALFAVGTAALILAHEQLPRTIRTLLVFGYFITYEYGVISRPYSVLVFLLVLFALLAGSASRFLVLIGIILGLAAETSAYGTIMAIPLVAYMAVRIGTQWGYRKLWPLGFAVAGIVHALHEMLNMPSDFLFGGPLLLHFDAHRAMVTLAALGHGFVPTPPWTLHFWNGSPFPVPVLAVLGVMVVVLVPVVSFRLRARLEGVLCVAGLTLILAFSYAVNPGAIRQHGLFFVFALVCVSLAMQRMNLKVSRASEAACVAILALHVLGTVVAAYFDLRFPFSEARAVARAINARNPDAFVAAFPTLTTSAVSGYLRRPVFYVVSARVGTYVIWNRARLSGDPRYADAVLDRESRAGTECLLVVQRNTAAAGANFVRIASYPTAIVPDETFDLYALRPRDR